MVEGGHGMMEHPGSGVIGGKSSRTMDLTAGLLRSICQDLENLLILTLPLNILSYANLMQVGEFEKHKNSNILEGVLKKVALY